MATTRESRAMPDPLPITVYSDVICPWCYVGKRRLEAAVASPGMPVGVEFTWRPFELNPDMPAEGVERKVYRTRKFGEVRSAELGVKMGITGRELGIEFAFDRMRRTPNTRLAHRLIWEADRQDRQDAVVERLFHGYFEEGLDIGQRSEEHTSELQSPCNLVCRLLLEKKKTTLPQLSKPLNHMQNPSDFHVPTFNGLLCSVPPTAATDSKARLLAFLYRLSMFVVASR